MSYRSLAPRRWTTHVALQVLFGLLIGLLIGTCINYDSEGDVDMHIQLVNHHNDSKASSSFFLRCVIMITPGAQKADQFVKAIRDTWGSECNRTLFYTTDANLLDKIQGPRVILVDSYSNGFFWEFYRRLLEHSAQERAEWTFVGDERLFAIIRNLRKTLSTFDEEAEVVVGRVTESRSLLSSIFPFAFGRRISHQAGVAYSESALKSIVKCNGFILPRSSEKAIVECARESGALVVDPVDEEGQHLLHSKDMISLIPASFRNETADIREAEGVAECCSDHSVSFGGLSYKEQRVAHFASSALRVFGAGGVLRTNTPSAKSEQKKNG